MSERDENLHDDFDESERTCQRCATTWWPADADGCPSCTPAASYFTPPISEDPHYVDEFVSGGPPVTRDLLSIPPDSLLLDHRPVANGIRISPSIAEYALKQRLAAEAAR